jgi:peroxiredoxin
MSQTTSKKPWLFIISGFLAGTLAGLVLLDIIGVLDIRSLIPGSAGGSQTGAASFEIGSPAPDFVLEDLSGNPVKLSDLKGRLVVLNFWATWCTPCRTEMPEFQEIYQQYEPELVVLGINLEQSPGEIQDFISPLSISYPILLDKDGLVSRLYKVIQLPNTYFIDHEGIIRIRHIGFLSSDQFHEYLDRVGVSE